MQHTADCRWVFSISVIGLQNLPPWVRSPVRSGPIFLNMITHDTFLDIVAHLDTVHISQTLVIKLIDHIYHKLLAKCCHFLWPYALDCICQRWRIYVAKSVRTLNLLIVSWHNHANSIELQVRQHLGLKSGVFDETNWLIKEQQGKYTAPDCIPYLFPRSELHCTDKEKLGQIKGKILAAVVKHICFKDFPALCQIPPFLDVFSR